MKSSLPKKNVRGHATSLRRKQNFGKSVKRIKNRYLCKMAQEMREAEKWRIVRSYPQISVSFAQNAAIEP